MLCVLTPHNSSLFWPWPKQLFNDAEVMISRERPDTGTKRRTAVRAFTGPMRHLPRPHARVVGLNFPTVWRCNYA